MQIEPCLCTAEKTNKKCFWYDKPYTNPYLAVVDRAKAHRDFMRQLPDGIPPRVLQGLPEAGVEPIRDEGEPQPGEWMAL